jgi:hypothetical protein
MTDRNRGFEKAFLRWSLVNGTAQHTQRKLQQEQIRLKKRVTGDLALSPGSGVGSEKSSPKK